MNLFKTQKMLVGKYICVCCVLSVLTSEEGRVGREMEASKFILYILKMLGSFIITRVIKKQLCGEGDETAE